MEESCAWTDHLENENVSISELSVESEEYMRKMEVIKSERRYLSDSELSDELKAVMVKNCEIFLYKDTYYVTKEESVLLSLESIIENVHFQEFLIIMKKTAESLSLLHREGVFHFDLKPSYILVDREILNQKTATVGNVNPEAGKSKILVEDQIYNKLVIEDAYIHAADSIKIRLSDIDPLISVENLEQPTYCEAVLQTYSIPRWIVDKKSCRFQLKRKAAQIDFFALGNMIYFYLTGNFFYDQFKKINIVKDITVRDILDKELLGEFFRRKREFVSEEVLDLLYEFLDKTLLPSSKYYYGNSDEIIQDIDRIIQLINAAQLKDRRMEVFHFEEKGSKKNICEDVYLNCDLKNCKVICLADGVSSKKYSIDGALYVEKAITKLIEEIEDIAFISEKELKFRISCTIKETIYVLSKKLGCKKEELASTLMLLVIPCQGDFFWSVHLGDGLIGTIDSENQIHICSYPQNGITKEYTYTTVSNDLYKKVHVKRHFITPFIFAMTDGTANEIFEKGVLKNEYKKYFEEKKWLELQQSLKETEIIDDSSFALISMKQTSFL